jgi:hypothetical protein
MIARQQGPAAVRNLNPVYVRFGSKADITRRSGHVRFPPESGQSADCAAFVGEARIACDHKQPMDMTKSSDDVLDDAIGEIVLSRLIAHVLKWQYGDRRLVRQC